LLTGKYRRGKPFPPHARILEESRSTWRASDDALEVVERLIAFAERRGHTILELAFAWLLSHQPVASVIAGATSPEQIRTNAEAGAWRLTDEDLREIETIFQ
jgi:aryl-alcohol dehydrogenase-like predicted oxidoreductase